MARAVAAAHAAMESKAWGGILPAERGRIMQRIAAMLRARTEEKHLSRDPEYVAYALWMNEHGVLRFLNKLSPALKYKGPAEPISQPAPVSTPIAQEPAPVVAE